MRLVLHTFRKDARRLRWQIAVALALQVLLANQDRWRADRVPNSVEGWLNLLLPLAWACLIGLTIEDEPLVGERQFWITRPHRWPELLGAKMLFIAAFIHLPAFLADSWILAARGFQPWEYLPQLLWKQLLLAGALTLPAAALATLVRNFTQFMLGLVVLAGGLAVVTGGLWNVGGPSWGTWETLEIVRRGVAILVAAAAAIAIVLMQYAARRTLASRAVGAAAAITAGLFLGYLPPTYAFGLRSAVSPAHAELTLRIAAPEGPPPPRMDLRRANVAIPVVISGIPERVQARNMQLALEVSTPGGEQYSALPPFQSRQMQRVTVFSYMSLDAAKVQWLRLQFNRSVYERLKNRRVTLKGTFAVWLYRRGETSNLPVGQRGEVAGVGRCSSFTVEPRGFQDDGMLKVVCESPAGIPPQTAVRLWRPEGGQEWNQLLSNNSMLLPGPKETWLSPVDRSVVYFQLAENPQGFGSQWLVPVSALGTARLAITPELVTGYAVLNYELKDVLLSDYLRAN